MNFVTEKSEPWDAIILVWIWPSFDLRFFWVRNDVVPNGSFEPKYSAGQKKLYQYCLVFYEAKVSISDGYSAI